MIRKNIKKKTTIMTIYAFEITHLKCAEDELISSLKA